MDSNAEDGEITSENEDERLQYNYGYRANNREPNRDRSPLNNEQNDHLYRESDRRQHRRHENRPQTPRSTAPQNEATSQAGSYWTNESIRSWQENGQNIQRQQTQENLSETPDQEIAQEPQRRNRTQIFTEQDQEGSGLNRFGNVPGRHHSLTREEFNPPGQSTLNKRGRYEGRPERQTIDQAYETRVHDDDFSRGSRPVRIQPFPKDIKAADKLFKWKYWLSTLELALEKSKIFGQREKAIELSLSAGEEVGMIIMTEGLMVKAEEAKIGFKYYDFLVEGITRAFGRLTDSNVNAREFTRLKQSEGESARDYALRARMAAQKIGLTNESLLAANFIDGLRDTNTKKWANAFNMPMEQALQVATRRETNPDDSEFPWSSSREGTQPISVAAVSKNERVGRPLAANEREQRKGPTTPPRNGRDRDRPRASRDQDRESQKRCGKCGRKYHNGPRCPAEKVLCHNCNEMGHFGVMCRTK